jgi:succinoglycan biosynthesis transport protein ExoP
MNDRAKKRVASKEEENKLDWQRLKYLLLSRIWLIVTCVTLAMGLAIFYLWWTPTYYEATAVVQVEQAPQRFVNVQEIVTEDYKPPDVLKTVEQSLLGHPVLLRVVKAKKLRNSKDFAPDMDTIPYTDDQLAGYLWMMSSAKLRRGTRLIDVSVEDEDPARAQMLANAIVEEFIELGADSRLGVSKEAEKFLFAEAARLKAKLESSEQALQKFKEDHNAVSLEDRQNIVVEKLKELNAKLTEAKTYRLKLESDLAQITQIKDKSPEKLLALASVANLPEIAEAKRTLNQRESDLVTIKQRYLRLHPKYIQASDLIQDARANLDHAIMNAGDTLAAAYEAAKENEAKLATALADQEKTALELNKNAIPFNALAREVESDKALYASVQTRLKETNVAQGVEPSSIRLSEEAPYPDKPSFPPPKRILAGAFVGSVILSLALIFTLNALDGTVRSTDQAEELLNIPVVGAVPLSKAKDPAVVVAQPDSPGAEAFRSVRAALSLQNDAPRQTTLITSAIPGEGKTYCSLNYALSVAQQGFSTVLIDADLRRPAVQKIFKELRGVSGLCNALNDTSLSIGEVCYHSGVENLSIVPCGDRRIKPAEALGSQRFHDLLEEAQTMFERIIIDCAPINAVSDPLLIAQHATSVCMVIRAGRTPRRAILRAAKVLARSGVTLAGVILNGLSLRRGADYFYYYYGEEYSNAGVYNEDAEKIVPS